MHPTRIIARPFKRIFTATLMVIVLFGAVILMPGVVGAALKAVHPALPAVGESLKSYPAQGPNDGTNPLIYNGGAVITNSQVYLIFEGSTWQQSYKGTPQTNQQRVEQYFSDVSGSALEGILTQYYYLDANGTRHSISNTISVAGSVLDLSFSYSNHCQGTNLLYDPGTTASPNDIADEITKEIKAYNWTNSASTIFFVFTPQDYTLALADCSGSGTPPSNVNFCGYHMSNVGYNYAAIAYQAAYGICNFASDTTDSMINIASHEQFEAITDPQEVMYAYGTGWNNGDCDASTFFPNCEIGDKCEASSQSGVNTHPGVYLNGTFYPGVQGEFSNATGNCEYTVAPPPPTPTPTNTPVTTCASTIETDNIEPGGTYTDNRGNTWHVYYDLKRDSVTNKPCQMRLVVRIFNPGPDGTWSGTTGVFAEVNGGVISASIGKVSGSCTYQYHFVWRGPWFNVSSGNYFIEDTEYNGSNPYARASANFTI